MVSPVRRLRGGRGEPQHVALRAVQPDHVNQVARFHPRKADLDLAERALVDDDRLASPGGSLVDQQALAVALDDGSGDPADLSPDSFGQLRVPVGPRHGGSVGRGCVNRPAAGGPARLCFAQAARAGAACAGPVLPDDHQVAVPDAGGRDLGSPPRDRVRGQRQPLLACRRLDYQHLRADVEDLACHDRRVTGQAATPQGRVGDVAESVSPPFVRAPPEHCRSQHGPAGEPVGRSGLCVIVTTMLPEMRSSPHLPSVVLHDSCHDRRCAYPCGHVK